MKAGSQRRTHEGDTKEPAAVFAARFRAAFAADDAEGHHRRLYCEPFGFDPREPAVVDALARRAASAVEAACVSLEVDRAVRKAVACRLADHWPLVEIDADGEQWMNLAGAERARVQWMANAFGNLGLMEYQGEQNGILRPRMMWPSSVSPDDVLAVVGRCKHRDAKVIAATMRAGQWYVAQEGDRRYRPGAIYPRDELYAPTNDTEASGLVRIADPDLDRALGTVFHPRLAALVAWAEKEVDAARRRPFIAVDAGGAMQTVLTAWGRGWQTDRAGLADVRPPSAKERAEGALRLLVRDEEHGLQLSLPLDGIGSADVFDAVKRTRGPAGLRHLAAFLLLLTTKGARSGQLLWKVSDHMDAMQCGTDTRRDPKARERLAREAAAVAGLRLEVYGDGADKRVSRALLLPVDTAERRGPDGRWTLEGMTLQVHPLLYSGVRAAPDQPGSHWFPASPDLPSLHHVKHAPALLAGLRLPQRWRWAYGKHGRTFVDLKRDAALALFGIEGDGAREHHKGRAWETFDANVAALAALPTPGIGAVEWVQSRDGEPMVRIHAARWMIERIAHRVAPIEAAQPPALQCGDDLRAWREARGLTQEKVAALLGVSTRTVRNAELGGAAPLPRSIRDAIARGAITPASPRALPSPR